MMMMMMIIIIIVIDRIVIVTMINIQGAPYFSTSTPNPPTNIVDFRGFDSSTILILRGGIIMSIGKLQGAPLFQYQY